MLNPFFSGSNSFLSCVRSVVHLLDISQLGSNGTVIKEADKKLHIGQFDVIGVSSTPSDENNDLRHSSWKPCWQGNTMPFPERSGSPHFPHVAKELS